MKVRIVKQRYLYDNFEYLVEVYYPRKNKYKGWLEKDYKEYKGWDLVAAVYDLKLAKKIKKLIEGESK